MFWFPLLNCCFVTAHCVLSKWITVQHVLQQPSTLSLCFLSRNILQISKPHSLKALAFFYSYVHDIWENTECNKLLARTSREWSCIFTPALRTSTSCPKFLLPWLCRSRTYLDDMAVPPLTHISRFPYHEIHKGLVITQVLSQYETGMQPEGASGPSPPVFCHQDVTKSFSVVCAG